MKNYLNQISVVTKSLFWITVGLLIYGYLCRIASIYFFWESKSIGWFLFFAFIVALLRDLMLFKKQANKKAVVEKIFIGFSLFVMLLKIILLTVIPRTSAYQAAVEFIKADEKTISKVGQVKSIFLQQQGSMAMSSSSEGDAGQADLYFVVKGTKKYMDINILMVKDFTTNWKIEIVE